MITNVHAFSALFLELLNCGTRESDRQAAKDILEELVLLFSALQRKNSKSIKCALCNCREQVKVTDSRGWGAFYKLPYNKVSLLLQSQGYESISKQMQACCACNSTCTTFMWEREER